MTVLEVSDLRVETAGGDDVVDGVTFSLAPGEILGIVGESGSGKSTIVHALLGYARRGAKITNGRILLDGVDVLGCSDAQLRSLRGRVISYVAQDPGTALNPALRLRTQLNEVTELHAGTLDAGSGRRNVQEVLRDVRLPDDSFLARFPHQISGGQQQRIAIAMAFLARPKVVVLDEPTTGLDVTTQSHVLDTVRRMCKAHQVAAVYVTHDLAVVTSLADSVLVMYAGCMAELGPRAQVLHEPRHPYTARLLAASPDFAQHRTLVSIPGTAPGPGRRPPGCHFHPRCELAIGVCSERAPEPVDLGSVSWCHRAEEVLPLESGAPVAARAAVNGTTHPLLAVDDLCVAYGSNQVLKGIALVLERNECLALVGESGSGKTTLGRAIAGLLSDYDGLIRYSGAELQAAAVRRSIEERQQIQYVFQNPYASLNPRRCVAEIIARPIKHFEKVSRSEARRRAAEAIELVALPSNAFDKYPDQLSGGERQRVAIARALMSSPKLLICDEVTSALDVSVQAAIIELLLELQVQQGLSLLFITHNLALMRNVADRIAVLNDGQIVEQGTTDSVLDRPTDEYTRKLIADTPVLTGA